MSPRTAQAPGTIRVLPQSLSARIAAGEVVERPASVVKELVENALDAGARRIDVEVREGGRSLIRVDDDGLGIPSEQIAVAFERFATSKIDEDSDLAGIRTLGFRGEALPSIASVSHVEATSRTAEESAGSRLLLSFGETQEREAYGRPAGTSVAVRDLFRNVPARMRFLASQGAELGRIQQVVASYALVRPDVAFTLRADGAERIATSGRGDLVEAAAAVYDARVADALLEVSGPEAGDPLASSGFAVVGAVAGPSVSRGNRNYTTLSVNGRWVHSRRLSFAVEQAYHGFLEERRFPIAVLRLDVPAGDVDVNVHPAKTEVKFLREQLLFSAIQRAVREVLLASSPVPVFSVPGRTFGASASTPAPLTANPLWPDPLTATPMDVLGHSGTGGASARPGGFDAASRGADPGPTPHGSLPGMRVIGQAQEMYLIAEGPDGVYLIDQHAAHERVLFEEIGDRLDRSETESQQLLAPEAVELEPQQEESYAAHGELLGKLGYSIEPFGPHTVLIRAVPAPMGGPAAAEGLPGALDSLAEGGSPAEWRERLIASMACHAAVTAGRRMEPEESRELVRRLELTRQPHTCPHARPTMIRLSSAALEREFKRS